MALPPTPVAEEMPPEAAAAPMAEEGAEECIATICRRPDGTFVLYAGDEPEEMEMEAEGGEPAPEGQTFDSPQALMRGVMELLNPAAGAEESFGKGFRGEPDAAAMKPSEMPPAA